MPATEFLIPLTVFSAIGYIVYVTVTNRRLVQLARMRTDMHGKLLDKLGSSQELVQYLESDAGRAFLEPPPADRSSAYSRILGAVQAGIILSLLGSTLIVLDARIGGDGSLVAGMLLLALGVGFLISAGVSFWLSKAWGLLGRPSTEG